MSKNPPTSTSTSDATQAMTVEVASAPRDGAGPGYVGEWALFCDYATATDQPALPTTVAALTGFLTALPARSDTLARRVRAIATAHRRAGYLLSRPDDGSAAPTPPRPTRHWGDAGAMIAACPTRGWPHGLHGRRDAFLIVLTVSLAHPYPVARTLTPTEITTDAPPDPSAGSTATADGGAVTVAGQTVPTDPDPQVCSACAVARWLDILGTLDGLGRGSARMDLVAADAVTPDDPHRHHPRAPHRWPGAAVLLPAIDQHGWHDDYRPITIRTIRTRLALAASRTALTAPANRLLPHSPDGPPDSAGPWPAGAPPARTSPSLNDVLTLLDNVADHADALNDRIQALLDGRH
ncbi:MULTISPECIES: hypothetical protein [unclassified Pseudonocardia]|uniref:hypothetical protein n=1 Tax=unclassified Pseudonocardia TaxID=2619320 RepID=UPI000760E595|nr:MULTISPECIES: hypothetical protein [unclassified Pseudonocardia]